MDCNEELRDRLWRPAWVKAKWPPDHPMESEPDFRRKHTGLERPRSLFSVQCPPTPDSSNSLPHAPHKQGMSREENTLGTEADQARRQNRLEGGPVEIALEPAGLANPVTITGERSGEWRARRHPCGGTLTCRALQSLFLHQDGAPHSSSGFTPRRLGGRQRTRCQEVWKGP